jgi:hypothetical protein
VASNKINDLVVRYCGPENPRQCFGSATGITVATADGGSTPD